jgi:Zn-dependent M16 (insulinase) family peptidase
MKEQERLHGFCVTRVRDFAELGGKLIEMEHEKTGAKLAWLDRPDTNKTFSIAFKTLPEDSTGVFHILEHSVLCGSDRYPVKEPFVELLKSSVQTFLNAMTYPDKTVYPVSSRNDRDFLNLIDIYLDAVFHPAIYHNPSIFRQEGWRYEGEGEDLCYTGVVLNEMKGSFGSPQTVLANAMHNALFPDNCYHFVSGGDPVCIPDLTYEQFLANHKKYYHPSNARISLVGSVDVDSVLEKIDSFLSAYTRREADFTIPMQRPVDRVVREIPYEIGEGEPKEGRAMISCASILGSFDTPVRNYAASVLSDYLSGDNDAPLKRAVIDRGLAQDFAVFMEDGLQQTTFGWQAMNTDADKLDTLEQAIRETLAALVKDGLDKERLEACFHSFAFRMRDHDGSGVPRSLTEALGMLDTWLYGGDPANGLLVEESLKELEAKLDTDYFEQLIRELFLENAHSATVVLTPSETLGKVKAEREKARLNAERSAWTEADRARLASEAEALRQFQQTPDSEEALSSIPMLKLSDLNDKPEPLSVTQTVKNGVTVLRHSVGSDLTYFKAFFAANELKAEELPQFSLLCTLLGSMATKRHGRAALQTAIKNTIGQLDFSPSIFAASEPDRCRVALCASAACLSDQAEKAADLLSEILTETVFDDLALVRDVLQQTAFGAKMSLPAQGHRYGMMRALAHATADGFANECIGGVTFMQWVNAMAEADDEALLTLLESLAATAKRFVTKERLTLSCSEAMPEGAIDTLLNAIPSDGVQPVGEASYAFAGAKREGVAIPAQVGFAVRATNLRLHDKAFSGSIPVLSNLLSYTYLWNEIRVQGGAYGCGFNGRDNGDLFFYTYRDPQPDRSLNVMTGSADFVRGFLKSEPDLTGFILSAISTVDPLRSSADKMAAAENRYFRHITQEQADTRYRKLVETTADDLLALCDALNEVAEDGVICVVASPDQLDACGGALEQRIEL